MNTSLFSKSVILVFICFSISSSFCWAQTVYVPTSHWVYEFFDRLESKGVIKRLHAGTKPMTRSEVASVLIQLMDVEKNGARINKVEQDQLTFLQFEYREELSEQLLGETPYVSRLQNFVHSNSVDKFLPDFIYPNGRNMLSFEEGKFKIFWDPIFLRSGLGANADTLENQERVYQASNGFAFWGEIGAHFGFLCDIRDTKEWGTRNYPERFDITAERLGFVNGYGDHIYHDETVAYATLQWPHFVVQFGKDSNRWGPGFRGSLALSDYATSYDLIKGQAIFSTFKFTSLMGFLRHYPPVVADGVQRDKAIAAHRLEFSPARWLDLAVHETVIYSGRQLEPAYLNPVMFYRSADHYLGDRDNVGMGLDFEFMALPKTKLYGELFLDDITTTKLGTGFYGNKYAYQLGAFHVDLFGIDNLDLRVEYTRIRPFVYSHRDSLNVYRHFTSTLGHFAGPNSDDLFLAINYRPHWRLKLQMDYEVWRHGANSAQVNYGGNMLLYRNTWDPEYVDTLSGVFQRTERGSVSARYELARQIFVDLALSASAGKLGQPTSGHDAHIKRSEISMSFGFNY